MIPECNIQIRVVSPDKDFPTGLSNSTLILGNHHHLQLPQYVVQRPDPLHHCHGGRLSPFMLNCCGVFVHLYQRCGILT